jgi:hypothetical protein
LVTDPGRRSQSLRPLVRPGKTMINTPLLIMTIYSERAVRAEAREQVREEGEMCATSTKSPTDVARVAGATTV